MKKTQFILPLLCFILPLLFSCNGDEQTNNNGSTTPVPQETTQEYEVRINQDLVLKGNKLNIDPVLTGGLAYGHPIYYGNSKCVLANIRSKFIDKNYIKKNLKKNEIYKVFGAEIDHEVLSNPSFTRLTIYLKGENPDLVYMWIDCFGDDVTQLSSHADLKKLLDGVLSFVGVNSHLSIFNPSRSKAPHLLGSEEALTAKKLKLNQNFNFIQKVRENTNTVTVTYSYINESCSLTAIENRPKDEDYSKNKYNDFSIDIIELRKGQNLLFESYPHTLALAAYHSSEDIIYAKLKIVCNDENLTLSSSSSDVEKLLEGAVSFVTK